MIGFHDLPFLQGRQGNWQIEFAFLNSCSKSFLSQFMVQLAKNE